MRRMCRSWCRYISGLNNAANGVPKESEVMSKLLEYYHKVKQPPQYHRAWTAYNAVAGPALPAGVKQESVYVATPQAHRTPQRTIAESNRKMKRKVAAVDLADLEAEVGRPPFWQEKVPGIPVGGRVHHCSCS